MDQGLVIVPAGAGAGKTHRIEAQLTDWIKRGIVRPERILAVTYTEPAAAELRERIRSSLLADGMVSEAMALERAYVSTIHKLGLRFLKEHAFAAGASPQPRQLGDAERDLLIRQALAHAKSLDPIKLDPERYGYKPDVQKGVTVEDRLRARVLAIIELLRGLGDKGHDPQLIPPALQRLDEIYGDDLADAHAARMSLENAVKAMIAAFPEGGMATITARTNVAALEKELSLFRRIMREPDVLDKDWSLWQALRRLFTSNRSSKTPDGYDALADAIMGAADVLPRHPGPLDDAKHHLQCLMACAQEVMEAYERRKKALGLIDFSDMITGAERLLRTDPAVRQAVLDEIDCVIIDEFQDTNPVQFALLWQLGANAPRTLLVGDVKQSIMGFQGADPQLSQALAEANRNATQPLDRNWRSTPAIMEFVNAVGEGLFGKEYNPLAPTRDAVAGHALELLLATQGRKTRKYSKPQEHVAERIARLLADKESITDRHNKLTRTARPSDIALLVCRHTTASRYAEELRARGVPVRIAEDGWSQSPVVQAARAALSFAANPKDIHAALVLRTLGPDPVELQQALSSQIDGAFLDDKPLARLSSLSDSLASLPVATALDLVLAESGVRAWADRRSDAQQARADLLRLEAEAVEFEMAHRDLKAAAGYHGETIKVFLGWLEARAGERDFDRRPDPSADVAEAVEIVTWHGSKGREWPITVVAELDHGIEEWPGTTSTKFTALERIDDMAAVLGSAAVVHTPAFAAPEAQTLFIEDRRADFEANARNLLYVALTRARDRMILEWPAFVKDRDEEAPEATNLFHILQDHCDPAIGEGTFSIGCSDFAAVITELPEFAGKTELASSEKGSVVHFGHDTPLAAMQVSPWRLQPSLAISSDAMPDTQSFSIGAPWPKSVNDVARGTKLHLALRTCLSRPDLAPALEAATGLNEAEIEMVSARAAELRTWLSSHGYDDLHCEVPVLGRTPEGAEIPGVIDLLAIGRNGSLLIDHKTGGSGEGLGHYWPQLSAYRALIKQFFPDHPLNGAAVFWVDHGRLDLVEFQCKREPV